MKIEGYVTLLKVDNEMSQVETTSSFITVVELEGEDHIAQQQTTSKEEEEEEEEEVVIYRLPGEKLGMGLKFEGGMHAAEYVSNVYIQSVAVGSPASRTPTVWGGLVEGDEIISVDGRKVCQMTRVDCVTTLKKAPVAIKLVILHRNLEVNNLPSTDVETSVVLQNRTVKLPDVPPLPPPIPPRKLRVRKESSSSDTTSLTDIGGENHISQVIISNRISNSNKLNDALGMKLLPGWEELMIKRSSNTAMFDSEGLPCPANVSVDLFADDDRHSLFNECESDDTGSSASTVIERLVHLHPMASSVKMPSLKKVVEASTLNLAQVLSPFEQLEVEIESDVLLGTSAFEKVQLEYTEHAVSCSEATVRQQRTENLLTEEPEYFSSLTENILQDDEEIDLAESVVNANIEPHFCCGVPIENRLCDRDIQPIPRQKTTPPPVPPRKLKHGRKNSLNLSHYDDQMSCLNFPIIGNLLQELEQLPEFPHPKPRSSSSSYEFIEEAISSVKSNVLQFEPLLSTSDILCGNLTDVMYGGVVTEKECQNSEDTSEVCDKQSFTKSQLSDTLVTAVGADHSFESLEVSLSLPPTNGAELILCSNVNVCAAPAAASENKASCEVVAVIEKPLQPACDEYALDALTSSDTTEMTASNSFPGGNFMEFPDDNGTVPSFSRLPPDGHEFPSCYKEPDICIPATYSDSEKEPFHFDSQFIQPPVGFEDNESSFAVSNRFASNKIIPSVVNLNGNEYEPLDTNTTGDSATVSSQSSEAGETVIFEEFLPPPPAMTCYLSDSTDSEPSKIHSMKVFDEISRETSNCKANKKIPPLPMKRRLPPKPNTSEKSRGKSEETLSVKDKIALFSLKAALALPSLNSKPGGAALRTPTPEVRSSIESRSEFNSNGNNTEVLEAIPSYDPIQHEVDYAKNAVDLSLGVANKFDTQYYDRPTSSLSMSSWLSKSSDDLLSQDIDSSDVDERGLSFFEKRLSTIPSNGRYNSDCNSQSGHWSTSSTDSDVADLCKQKASATNRSMYSILESRKQNVTKLKGLVIPERKEVNLALSTPDLPLIFSVDSILLPKVELQYHSENTRTPKDAAVVTANDNLAQLSKSSPMLTTGYNVPKYSPAFKRKGFSVFEGTSAPKLAIVEKSKLTTDNNTIRTETSSSKPIEMLFDGEITNAAPVDSKVLSAPPLPKSSPPQPKDAVLQSICGSSEEVAYDETDTSAETTTLEDAYHYGDTEDQESGISSIESPNVSIHNTPPGSPRELHSARLTFSTNSSDTNCEDENVIFPARKLSLPSKRDMNFTSKAEDPLEIRVLKANSVEAINRMNVLQSSRNSCGGVAKDEVVDLDADRSLMLSSSQAVVVNVAPVYSHRRQVSLDEMISFSKTEMLLSVDLSEKSHTLKREKKPSINKVMNLSNSNNTANGKPPPLPSLLTPKTVSDERWEELAKKYGKTSDDSGVNSSVKSLLSFDGSSRHVFKEGRVNSSSGTDVDSAKSDSKIHKCVANQWKCRSSEAEQSVKANKNELLNSTSVTSSKQSIKTDSLAKSNEFIDCEKENYPEAHKEDSQLPRSTNEFSMRQKKSLTLPRPTSLIETDTRKLQLCDVALGNASKMGYSDESHSSGGDTPLRASTKPNSVSIQDLVNSKSRRSTSFNDLRQIFENQEMSLPSRKQLLVTGDQRTGYREMSQHMRMSSLDSTASDSDVGTPIHYGSATSLGSSAIDHYGSITSLASSTSLISPQELQQLIDEANQSLEESGTLSHEISVIVLQREIPGGSIGITLAGGADYDCKEITTPRTDCVLVLSRSKSATLQEVKESGNTLNRIGNGNSRGHQNQKSQLAGHRYVNGTVKSCAKSVQETSSKEVSQFTVKIVKDGSGLGFSLEGGKDSPFGDKPLTIKKIFTGSAADKHSQLNIGDEVVSINGTDVTKMARIEAWNFMRKLPDGLVSIVINHSN